MCNRLLPRSIFSGLVDSSICEIALRVARTRKAQLGRRMDPDQDETREPPKNCDLGGVAYRIDRDSPTQPRQDSRGQSTGAAGLSQPIAQAYEMFPLRGQVQPRRLVTDHIGQGVDRKSQGLEKATHHTLTGGIGTRDTEGDPRLCVAQLFG